MNEQTKNLIEIAKNKQGDISESQIEEVVNEIISERGSNFKRWNLFIPLVENCKLNENQIETITNWGIKNAQKDKFFLFLINNQCLSNDYIQKYKDVINWKELTLSIFENKDIFDRFIDYLDWEVISIEKNLSEDFIEKHKEKLNWSVISINKNLSEDFIEKHQDQLNWDHISLYQTLSEGFIEKHADKINWKFIGSKEDEIINITINGADLEIASDRKRNDLSPEFLEKHKDKLDWKIISKYQPLSDELIIKYEDLVNWYYISRINNISENIINRYADKLDWGGLCTYQKLSEDILYKYSKKIIWDLTCRHQKLSETFIDKFKNRVYWNYIILFQKISPEFAKSHIQYIKELYLDNNSFWDINDNLGFNLKRVIEVSTKPYTTVLSSPIKNLIVETNTIDEPKNKVFGSYYTKIDGSLSDIYFCSQDINN